VRASTHKHVGNAKLVSVSGISVFRYRRRQLRRQHLSQHERGHHGARSGNLASGQNKIYDGNATAVVTLADDRVADDALTTGFGSAELQTTRTSATPSRLASWVSPSRGADAGNYVANTLTSTSADISARTLAVAASGQNKIYDGNVTATVTLADDRVAATLSPHAYGSASFSDKNVGNAKPVSGERHLRLGCRCRQLRREHFDKHKRQHHRALSTHLGERSEQDLRRQRHRSRDACRRPSGWRCAYHGFASASFNDKNVSNAKPVSVTGISVSGADAGNYVANTSTSTSADITPRTLAISASGQNKIYERHGRRRRLRSPTTE
jgi:hypothetical protein